MGRNNIFFEIWYKQIEKDYSITNVLAGNTPSSPSLMVDEKKIGGREGWKIFFHEGVFFLFAEFYEQSLVHRTLILL